MSSNSPLVNYTSISPYKTSPRNHEIDTITIHCVVGQCFIETLGAEFSRPGKNASSNYGIGFDGRIGMYVEECDRSWCSSNADNDNRAITIEVASDTTHPYAVTDAAYASLIKLLVDICKRNNIKELKWKADKSLIGQVDKQNMTVHRWFANKSCPGEYLYSRHGQIAAEVNALLNGEESAAKKTVNEIAVEVIQGKWGAGADRVQRLAAAGYDPEEVQACVNEIFSPKPVTPKKTVDELAKEVLQGKWGAGSERKRRLEEAGYDYNAVQKRVNELLTPKKTIDELAREVIRGKWGFGSTRKRRLTQAGYDYNAVQKRVNELLR